MLGVMAPKPVGVFLHSFTSITRTVSAHMWVRSKLRRIGYDGNPYCPLPLNGSYNSIAIKGTQWKLNKDGNYGLVVDGIYGPLTSGALEAHIGRPYDKDLYPGNGLFSQDVVTLQSWCRALGFPVTQDGFWGNDTTTAVKAGINSTRF